VKRAGDEMDTQDLIEVLAREVLKEIAKRENQSLSENIKHSPEKSIITAFLGNDEVLKDELKKETSVVDNIKLDSTWEEIEKNEKFYLLVLHCHILHVAYFHMSKEQKSYQ